MSGARHAGTAGLTVAVGMSGGVDSSLAAILLMNSGYKVIGLTMAIGDGSIPIAETQKSGCFRILMM